MATTGNGSGGGGSINGSNSSSVGGGLNLTAGRTNVSVTSINCEATTSAGSISPSPFHVSSSPSSSSVITAATTVAVTTTGSISSCGSNNFITNGPSLHQTTNAINNNNNNQHFYGNVGIRISVPKMEESDESETELSNIEKTAIVNMRTNHHGTTNILTAPRPMSWEGELSEPEDDMDTNEMINFNVDEPPNIVPYMSNTCGGSDGGHISSAILTTQSTTPPSAVVSINDVTHLSHALPLLTRDTIKPEYSETIADLTTVNIRSSSSATAPPPTTTTTTTVASSANTFLMDYKKADCMSVKKFPIDLNNLKYEPGYDPTSTTLNSPLLARSKTNLLPANPSPDSAIHSVYTHSSPSQSPLTSRHAPYTPSLSRNNSDASHSSCYSYSSEFSPTHSPIQGRHHMYNNSFNGSPLHHSVLYRPLIDSVDNQRIPQPPQSTPHHHHHHHQQQQQHQQQSSSSLINGHVIEDIPYESEQIPSAGISRQQLINSPCPICGDKISGFHYGIFSCESCKGFFKRTVQNRKNYVCLRGAACPVTIATRKKCPACRFEKCLQRGMKLEAIREDRTRGGRSTYQCSYTLPNSMLSPPLSGDSANMPSNYRNSNGPVFKIENIENGSGSGTMSMIGTGNNCGGSSSGDLRNRQTIPSLLQEIMDVEHLWQYNESELSRLNQTPPQTSSGGSGSSSSGNPPPTNPLLVSAGLNGDNTNPDLIANLCNVADHRLYKIVKWCKSLPLFKHITIDDQICLLINAWCELLLFSCCFRSMTTPGEVRVGVGKSINLAQAKTNGLHACIERMLNLTDHLRRLRVDKYEYVAMKVIVLLQSDTSELREPEKVRASQEKALQALQAYTLAHYPESPAKFGELLLRIPELQRTCQVGKEMLTVRSKDGEDFNILMELLRGEH